MVGPRGRSGQAQRAAGGPERGAIELETDRRAAGPYAALTAEERLTVLADLPS
ncbi:hypothetical protein ABZ807_28485 [Micromonospora sp. NPDC047548]|uniref:hypothetical protein n=1 Tax=Micromonospora sp. NPDC047548 TaxID=3155624 RepID=UPI0033CF6398